MSDVAIFVTVFVGLLVCRIIAATASQGTDASRPCIRARSLRHASRRPAAARNGAGSRNGGSDAMRPGDAATARRPARSSRVGQSSRSARRIASIAPRWPMSQAPPARFAACEASAMT